MHFLQVKFMLHSWYDIFQAIFKTYPRYRHWGSILQCFFCKLWFMFGRIKLVSCFYLKYWLQTPNGHLSNFWWPLSDTFYFKLATTGLFILISFFSLNISFSKITHFCGIQTKIISIEGEALTTVPTPRPMCDIFLETIQIALGWTASLSLLLELILISLIICLPTNKRWCN